MATFYFFSDKHTPHKWNTDDIHSSYKSNTKEDWEELLKFGGDEPTSGWFIDSTYYKGAYNDKLDSNAKYCPGCTGEEYLNQFGMLRLNDVPKNLPSDPHSRYINNHPGSDSAVGGNNWGDGHIYSSHGMWNYPNWDHYPIMDRNTIDHNNGIYEENGKYYIDLAFSSVGENLKFEEGIVSSSAIDGFKHLWLENYEGMRDSWTNRTCGRWEGTMHYADHFGGSSEYYKRGNMPVCQECAYLNNSWVQDTWPTASTWWEWGVNAPYTIVGEHYGGPFGTNMGGNAGWHDQSDEGSQYYLGLYKGCNPNYSWGHDPSVANRKERDFYGDLADIDGYRKIIWNVFKGYGY